MTIPFTPEVSGLLSEYRTYLASQSAREAFDLFVNTAQKDERYTFSPRQQGALQRTVRYMVGTKWAYGFIVNQSDMLFYYRLPSGRATSAVLESIRIKGLNAKFNNSGEITVRVTTTEHARLVLEDCFGSDLSSATEEVGGTEWTDDELRASVQAYRRMQQLQRDGQTRFKKQIYAELAEKFGRSEKAFEFRMQNISAVLALLGREWLEGLKPAAHVGAGVALRIETCINELDGLQSAGEVAFEIAVRENIKRQLTKAPPGIVSPERVTAMATFIKRDPYVKAWVLNRAKGLCECCGSVAPFEASDGTGYLEVHHLRRLADGGTDRPTNAIALCPNCHRRMHYGKDANEIRADAIARIPELKEE